MPSFNAFFAAHILKDEDAHTLDLDSLKGNLRTRLDATTQDDYKATFDNFIAEVDNQLKELCTHYEALEKPEIINKVTGSTKNFNSLRGLFQKLKTLIKPKSNSSATKNEDVVGGQQNLAGTISPETLVALGEKPYSKSRLNSAKAALKNIKRLRPKSKSRNATI